MVCCRVSTFHAPETGGGRQPRLALTRGRNAWVAEHASARRPRRLDAAVRPQT